MGADLILNFVWANKDKEPDWDGAREYIVNLTEKDIPDHPNLDWTDFANLKKDLIRYHDTIREAWNDGHYDRATLCCNIGKYRVLVTGGTSWGDSPSDVFDEIQDWGIIEGLSKFGFYPSD